MNNKHTITVNGEIREIFMSFGLLTTLVNVIGNPIKLASVSVDPEVRDVFLSELLASRKPSGKIITPIEDLSDIDISVDDAESLLNWASEQVMGFFLRSLQKANGLMEKNKTALEALLSSGDGSKS